MPKATAVAVLSLGQNGQVTIPAEFRRQHALAGGGKLLAVRMGDALVMAPHDAVLESICVRLEEAMKGTGMEIDELQAATLVEREAIVKARYGTSSTGVKRKRRR